MNKDLIIEGNKIKKGSIIYVEDKNIIDSMILCEMANVRPQATGLPMTIYISDKEGVKHGPRLKVSQNYGIKINKGSTFSITISDKPEVVGKIGDIKDKDLKMVINFILLNKNLLLDYWDYKISFDELYNEIYKLRKNWEYNEGANALYCFNFPKDIDIIDRYILSTYNSISGLIIKLNGEYYYLNSNKDFEKYKDFIKNLNKQLGIIFFKIQGNPIDYWEEYYGIKTKIKFVKDLMED